MSSQKSEQIIVLLFGDSRKSFTSCCFFPFFKKKIILIWRSKSDFYSFFDCFSHSLSGTRIHLCQEFFITFTNIKNDAALWHIFPKSSLKLKILEHPRSDIESHLLHVFQKVLSSLSTVFKSDHLIDNPELEGNISPSIAEVFFEGLEF